MDKLDFSKPELLQTRDGRSVRIYATDHIGIFPIIGAVLNANGWCSMSWTNTGYVVRDGEPCSADIVAKPYRMTGWVNVYEGVFGSTIFATKEAAKAVAGERALGQIYVDAEVQE